MKRSLTPAEQAKSDERKARFRVMVKQIADMSDGDRAAIAAKMIGLVTTEGRSLSMHNCCMIWSQFPTATVVGGFRQWIKQGRAVRKGEHGIMIWVPMMKGKAEGVEGEKCGFICGTVFDVSQTQEIEVESLTAA